MNGSLPRPMTIWIVEDNTLVREPLAQLINQSEGLSCPVHVGSCEEALRALEEESPPDVVLLDIGLPGMDGIEGMRRMHAISPTTRILMLTVRDDDDGVFEAICAGANGYLLKPTSPDAVIDSIREARNGGSPINAHIAGKLLERFQRLSVPQRDYGLTKREADVLKQLVDGFSQKRIAERLFVSEETIKTHIRNIYAKMHVHTRSGVVFKALRERVV